MHTGFYYFIEWLVKKGGELIDSFGELLDRFDDWVDRLFERDRRVL